MNHKISGPTMGLAAMLLVAATAPPAVAGNDQFTLARGVPNDAFVFINIKHNPESAFVGEYWGEVCQALRDSGIGDDVLGLVSSLLGEKDRAELDRFVDTATELIRGVDWDALAGGEVGFFERLSAPQSDPSGISMAPPDMVMIFRHANDKAAANYDGLLAIVDTLLNEIGKATNSKLPVLEHIEENGLRIASLPLITLKPDSPPYGLRIAQRNEFVIVAIGDHVLDEVLDLLAGKNAEKSMANSPRFKAAFAGLPAAENEIVFLDMQRLLNPIRLLATHVSDEMGGGGGKILNTGMSHEANRLIGESVAAYQKGNIDKAIELITQAHEAEPRDTIVMYNLACFHALASHKDEALDWLDKAVEGGFRSPGKILADTDLKSLREEPRFKAAVKKAENAVADGSSSKANVVRTILDRIIEIPGMIDYIASVGYTDGYSIHSEMLVTLTPDASTKPFYPVITKRKPLEQFDRYIPEEAVAFSVSSGIDLDELYTFIEDSIRMVGPDGVELLAKWDEIQADAGVDVRKDVLGWIDGDVITVTMPGMQSGVFMLKVKDEDVARQKISAALDALSEALVKGAEKNPMLAMWAIRTAPLNNENLEGFERLYLGMNAMVWGVADGYLVFGVSDKDVMKCLGAAKGEHPSVRSNKQVMAEAILPDGPFTAMSYTDYRNIGQFIAGMLGMTSMGMGVMSMAVPEPDVRSAIAKVASMLGKLTPVVGKIDFYKSTASVTTFNGKAWRCKTVTHYVSPDERNKAVAATE